MISFTQTWSRITKQMKRKKSFQSHESLKSVRFYGVDAVYYTHSSYDYDRTPTEELYEDDDDVTDDDDDEDDDENSIQNNNDSTKPIIKASSPPTNNNLLMQKSCPSPSTAISVSSAKFCSGDVAVVYDQSLQWEKAVPCSA